MAEEQKAVDYVQKIFSAESDDELTELELALKYACNTLKEVCCCLRCESVEEMEKATEEKCLRCWLEECFDEAKDRSFKYLYEEE